MNQDYLFYERWQKVKDIVLPQRSLYIYERDMEDRSVYCPDNLKDNNASSIFASVKEKPGDIIEIGVDGGNYSSVSLHSQESILGYVRSVIPSIVYLDVTGMSSRVAAPIMKTLIESRVETRVVYVEPREYIVEEFQREGIYKDLSEEIDGINPLPGFARIVPLHEDSLFVALLGFEGWRFSYLLSIQQPADDKIRPLLGVPGYKMGYPYDSLWGNRNAISKTECWRYLDFADANSIVDAFFKLEALYVENRKQGMVVAPIGTKPHVIGAIMYAIKYPDRIELLYDNPKRTLHRTKGVGRVMVCNVTSLFNA